MGAPLPLSMETNTGKTKKQQRSVITVHVFQSEIKMHDAVKTIILSVLK